MTPNKNILTQMLCENIRKYMTKIFLNFFYNLAIITIIILFLIDAQCQLSIFLLLQSLCMLPQYLCMFLLHDTMIEYYKQKYYDNTVL